MYKAILILVSIFLILNSCSNKNEEWKIEKINSVEVNEKFELLYSKLINEKNPNKEYILGNWNENKFQQNFKYLGSVKTKKNENIDIITLKLYVGEITKRGNGRIFIADKQGILGSYYISNINDLPQKMEKGILIFENKNNHCDQIDTRIDFTTGIPDKIFRKCNGNQGDLYEFQIEE